MEFGHIKSPKFISYVEYVRGDRLEPRQWTFFLHLPHAYKIEYRPLEKEAILWCNSAYVHSDTNVEGLLAYVVGRISGVLE